MSRFFDKSVMLPSLLLALMLLAAQFSGLAHAYKHDPGTPQSQTCTSCIVASQLASACVDTPATTDLEVPGTSQCALQSIEFDSFHTIVARQRGPPSAL